MGSTFNRWHMSEIHTFKNKRGANIEIGEFRPNTYYDYAGCTIDIHITVYSDDFKRKFSFWLMDYDTGWDGEGFMEGYFESELENNEDFNEDMALTDVYTEKELEDMVWDDILSNYEFYAEGCAFLDHINRIEDAMAAKAKEQFEDCGFVEDPEIDALFSEPAEEFWEDLEEEDLIDYKSMAKDGDVFVRTEYGERYTDLVDDFAMEYVGDESETEETPELLEKVPASAVQYCKAHPADCLLLPYAICRGMLDTHFMQPTGLPGQVCRLMNEADWSDAGAAEETLRAVRRVVLTELKKSRWLDIMNWNYGRYKYYDDVVVEADGELKRLCRILGELCPKTAYDIQVEFPFELTSDRSADILRLRGESNVVIPEKVAYDFLVDAPMRDAYSKQVLHLEKNYEPEKLASRLALIKDEVFGDIEDHYLNGSHIDGLFDAGRVLKEYDGEAFVAQIRDAESKDDFYEENEHGGVYSHGIHYFCTDHEFTYTKSKWVAKNPGLIRVRDNEKTEYRGPVHIPSTVVYQGRQYPVATIDYEAFRDCTKVTRVVIEDGLTGISQRAFSGCTRLSEITLPASLKVLDLSCFEGCTSLKSIHIPAGVSEIDPSCFEGCSQLAEIVVDDSNSVFKSVGGVLCDKASGRTLYVPEANKATDDDLVRQGEIIEEEDGVFTVDGIRYEVKEEGYWNESGERKYKKALRVLPLEDGAAYSGKVSIPARVKYHGFWHEVTTIWESAFRDCPDLLQVDVPASIIWMFNDVAGSPRLAAVNIDEGNEYFTSCDGVVYNKKLSEIVCYPQGHGERFEIPPTVNSIGKEFSNCSPLRSVIIPSTVTELYAGAFEGCTGLNDIFIPGSVKCIRVGCFDDCTGLETVTLGEGVESIDYAFKGCTSLQRIVLPDSLKSVEFSAFSGCGSIGAVRFPKDRYIYVRAIPKELFPWGHESFILDGICFEPYRDGHDEAALRVRQYPRDLLEQAVRPGVETISIPATVERYGFKYKVKQFWSDCAQFPDLRRLELPKTLVDINILCSGLKEIVVDPANPAYASIDGILYGDDFRKLVAVPRGREISQFTVAEGVEVIGEKVFAGRTDLEEVVLPGSVREIGSGAFENCTTLTRVRFNSGLEKIGSGAFQNTALTSVKLPSSLKEICQERFTGVKPFYQCRNLKEFVIYGDDGPFTTIGGLLYQKSSWGLKLIFCPHGITGKLEIPDGVYSIQDNALCGIEGLESVVMPDSVVRIEGWAFAMCKSLKEVILSRELQYVGSCAFRECPSLKELDFTRCRHYFGYDGMDTAAFAKNPQLKLILPANMEHRRVHFEREMKEK